MQKSNSIRLWVFAGLFAFIAIAWTLTPLFRGVLIIFAGVMVGIFLKYLTDQVSRISQFRYETTYGILIFLLSVSAGAAFYFMGSHIAASAEQFLQQFQQAQGNLFQEIESTNWWKRIAAATNQKTLSTASEAVSNATWAASIVLTAIGGFFLILFLGFYFALQPKTYFEGALKLVSPGQRSRASEVLSHAAGALWKWMLGRLVGMVVIGLFSAVGLWAIGIPLPITLGVLAGFLNFIPNVGPLISAVPPLLFGLQQGGNAALYVLLLYLALQFVESYFLTPLITQHQVSLPPGLTLSAQLLFGIMAGLLGLLMATPMVVVAHTAIQDLYPEDSS